MGAYKDMERTLEVLNELEREGVISRYAIGGAMGAAYYLEPVATFDLDIFVVLPEMPSGLLTLEPVYEKLRVRGYKEEAEFVWIEGVPVQFLPAHNLLLEEALQEAIIIEVEGVQARVLRAEHLIAICVQTGREKDRQRVRMFRDQTEINITGLRDILERHSLLEKWNQWTN